MSEERREKATLVTLIILFLGGICVFKRGESLYKTTSVQPTSRLSSGSISLDSNMSNTNLTHFEWIVAAPYNKSVESKWRHVIVRIGSIETNYTLNIKFPHEARHVRGWGFDLVDSSYIGAYDDYNLTIIPRDHTIGIVFEWSVFRQWTYDTYSIEMPLIPFFYDCVVDSSRVEIVTPEGAYLDMSRTFPYPNSSIGEVDSPKYIWEFSKPHEIRKTFPPCLRTWFIFPERSGSLRDTAFSAGIFVSVGLSMIVGGITSLLAYLVYAWSPNSWTRKKLRKAFHEDQEDEAEIVYVV